jgi:hypothetical protein
LHRKYRYFFLVAFALFLSHANSISARPIDTSVGPKYWLSAGVGLCSLGYMGGSASLTLQVDHMSISMRTTATSAGLFEDEYYDFGLLMGYSSQIGRGHVSIAAGIANVTGSHSEGLNLFSSNGNGRKNISPSVGVPIEVQLYPQLSRILDLGIYGYANLNSVQNFAGITLSVRLGKLR